MNLKPIFLLLFLYSKISFNTIFVLLKLDKPVNNIHFGGNRVSDSFYL